MGNESGPKFTFILKIGLVFCGLVTPVLLCEVFCYFLVSNGKTFPFPYTGVWFLNQASKQDDAEILANSRFGIFPSPPSTVKTGGDNVVPPPQSCDSYNVDFSKFWQRELFNREKFFPTLLPNQKMHAIASTKTGEVLFDVSYNIDSFGRRITPVKKNFHPDNFLLLLGSSEIFGVGVEDEETLPAQIAKLTPRYHVYNYGMVMSGPNGLLSWLRRSDLKTEVNEKRGRAIYFFIYPHLAAALGSMRFVTHNGMGQPYIYLDDHGDLIIANNFAQVHPWRMFFYKILSKSYLLTYFGRDFLFVDSKELQFVTRIIKEMKKEMEKQLILDRFYVIFLPTEPKEPIYFNRPLMAMFEKNEINFIDISNWNIGKIIQKDTVIPYECHYNPATLSFLAQQIVGVLEL